MSLFPAYAEQAKELEAEGQPEDQPPWLQNSSFNPSCAIDPNAEKPKDSSKTHTGESAKKKKRKERKRKRSIQLPLDAGKEVGNIAIPEDFTIDEVPIREYLKVETIYRPAVSKYKTKYYLTPNTKPKKSKFRRYFKVLKNVDPKPTDDDGKPDEKITKQNFNKLGTGERNDNYTGFIQEEELSRKTAFFNRKLDSDPTDIKRWLEYVKFQDTVYQFEKSYKKGSIAKAQRVQAERKISILEKALSLNPGCEDLLRERLNVAVSAYPADELQAQFKKLVDKQKHNIILWQGYIEATQCSMSHCNSPAVLSLYTQCLSTLHHLRRTTLSEKQALEESILKMLYQCGLFLKQSGLFEQLWTLLKMYLELSLSPADRQRFNIEKYFCDKELLELEEVVLGSRLPHHELWLRIEKLRESCHWLPYIGDEDCEDPQRLVFNEDVAELIHPITIPENVFKLVALTLTLLKVPLLPCRHTIMQDLGLDYVPWSLDSVEAVLPVFMSLYSVDITNDNLLKDTSRLAVSPQYLKTIPGQDEYLHFILALMESCAECLTDKDQISIRVWWFRFQRLLIVLDNQGRMKMPTYLKKSIKSKIKDLLKREDCRNNEIFYVEYALIEKSLGNADSCLKIIKTALSMNKNKSIETENWGQAQINQCYLYRVLVETIMEANKLNVKETVLELLAKLALQRNVSNLNNGLMMEAESRFKRISFELVELNVETKGSVEHFLPDFLTDWIICHGWFLYWSKGPIEAGVFLEEIVSKLETKQNTHREIIYEFYCAILFKYCLINPGRGVFKMLDNILFRAIELFPNNLFLLSILAKEQSLTKSFGISAWKVQDLLLKTGRAIASTFTVIILDLVKIEIEKEIVDSITGNSYDLGVSFKNRMISLFKKITAKQSCAKRCGLAWRLYLQFVHANFDPSVCRNIYYSAVEECPWLKALYMDAAIYIPAELAQIQDLIVEKQLRLHVTPEELDILRGSI